MNTKSPTTRYRFVTLLLGAFFLVFGGIGQALAVPGIVEKTSANSFEQTVQKLKRNISANKLVLLKEFDHKKMVKMVGINNAEKSKMFEVFHPRYGKPINAKDRSAFMVVPLRILVQQDGNKVIVRYQQASVLFKPYKGLDGLGKELDTLLGQIVNAATK